MAAPLSSIHSCPVLGPKFSQSRVAETKEDASNSFFTISPKRLEELVQANNITEIVAALDTNIDSGISGTSGDLIRRTLVFGSNTLEYRSSLVDAKGFHQLILEALKDSPVILLLLNE